MRMILVVSGAVISLVWAARTRQRNGYPAGNDDYMMPIMQAAPPQIVSDTTVVRMLNDKMETLRNQRVDIYRPAPPSPCKSGWRASAKSSVNG